MACWHLAHFTLGFIATERHDVWACCKFAGDEWSNVEQGFGSRLSIVSRRTLHQRSSAVGPRPSASCLCLVGFLFFAFTSCCLVVCATCCVMKGQSRGKRGSWHGNKVLHISTYLPALKASEVTLVPHSCEDNKMCESDRECFVKTANVECVGVAI